MAAAGQEVELLTVVSVPPRNGAARPASRLAQPPGLDALGLGVGDPLPDGVGDPLPDGGGDVLVDGNGVARAVADLEELGVTVGDGLAFGVALRVLDADGDVCLGVGVRVVVGVVVGVGVGVVVVGEMPTGEMYNARTARKKSVMTAVDVRTGRCSRSQERIGISSRWSSRRRRGWYAG
jgi:hypothetical protein